MLGRELRNLPERGWQAIGGRGPAIRGVSEVSCCLIAFIGTQSLPVGKRFLVANGGAANSVEERVWRPGEACIRSATRLANGRSRAFRKLVMFARRSLVIILKSIA